MKHQVELLSPQGDHQLWILRGVATDPEVLAFIHSDNEKYGWKSYAEQIGVDETRDTILFAVGRDHTCDSAVSEAAALFGALYDEYQTNDQIKEGDTFTVSESVVNQYHHYNATLGTFTLPALSFAADGVEIVPADSVTKALLNAYQQISDIDSE